MATELYTICLNDNKDLVKKLKSIIKKNGGYCPCSTIKSADTLCMCKAFREQKEEELCHCGLFYKKRTTL